MSTKKTPTKKTTNTRKKNANKIAEKPTMRERVSSMASNVKTRLSTAKTAVTDTVGGGVQKAGKFLAETDRRKLAAAALVTVAAVGGAVALATTAGDEA